MTIRLPRRPRFLLGALLVSGALVSTGLAYIAPARAVTTLTTTTPPPKCAAVDLAIVRGTAEPGKYGSIVGDPLSARIAAKLSGKQTLSVYKVNYPASILPGSADKGQHDLVAHLVRQAAACPDQKFVLSGYSQGALVVDMAMGITIKGHPVTDVDTILPAALAPRVNAVVLFGNPLHLLSPLITTGVYAKRVLDTCRSGDPACELGGLNIDAHTGYAVNTEKAAVYAVAKV